MMQAPQPPPPLNFSAFLSPHHHEVFKPARVHVPYSPAEGLLHLHEQRRSKRFKRFVGKVKNARRISRILQPVIAEAAQAEALQSTSSSRFSTESTRALINQKKPKEDIAEILKDDSGAETLIEIKKSGTRNVDLVETVLKTVRRRRKALQQFALQSRIYDDNWKKQATKEEIKQLEERKKEELAKGINLWNKWSEQAWLKTHGRGKDHAEMRERMKHMKTWFEFLDADKSGEIGIEELEGPLIDVGLARSRAEVLKLLRSVDKTGNGEINYEEFLDMMKQKRPPPSHERRLRGGMTPKAKMISPSKKNTNNVSRTKRRSASQNKAKGSSLTQVVDEDSLEEENPIVRLFAELRAQNLDDGTGLSLPNLMTQYRRKMLLNANMAEPGTEERIAGEQVLEANNQLNQLKEQQQQSLQQRRHCNGGDGFDGHSTGSGIKRIPTKLRMRRQNSSASPMLSYTQSFQTFGGSQDSLGLAGASLGTLRMPSSAMNLTGIQGSLTEAFASKRSQIDILRGTHATASPYASPFASPKGVTRQLSRARIKRASSSMRLHRKMSKSKISLKGGLGTPT